MIDRMQEISTLLEREGKEDLQKARELTRGLLTEMTSNIATIFLDRLILMGQIASSKRKSEAILQLDREYDLILKFSEIAKESGEDERMMQMLIWLITAAGKEKQRRILGRENVFAYENISEEELKNNLLSLTKEVADNYGEYGEGFNATKLARIIELDFLKENLPNSKKLAIDLGCADGAITKVLEGEQFEEIHGYDISSDMIKQAKKQYTGEKILYKQKDLFEGIPEIDSSVDFVVANFGSASEVHPELFSEIERVLTDGGRVFLSFYNKDSLMDNWWQPWQSSMETIINTENNFIEVPIIKQDGNHEVFKVFAKARSSEEINKELETTKLNIKETYSHSLITSMMPPMFFDNTQQVEQVIEYEKQHSKYKPYLGHYLVYVLEK